MPESARVVVIDDDEAVLDSVRVLLELEGFNVETFGQASVFLQRCEGKLPGCLVTDVRMPDMDGLELLRRLRADPKLALVPIVLMTSSREQPDLRAAYELGANAYVVKPVHFEDFRKAVATLGVFWAVLNESPATAT